MQKVVLAIVLVVVVVGAYALVTYLQPAQNQDTLPELVEYRSSATGVSFIYPDTYVLTERDLGNAERRWHTITLVDKEAAANIPQNGEGPPTITIQDFSNIEGLTVDKWIVGDARSNFKLSQSGEGGIGLHEPVGGKEALMYSYSGLYENDAVVVAANEKVYFFSVAWLTREDRIRKDFEALLKTVVFTLPSEE